MLWIYTNKLGGGYSGEPSIFDDIKKDDVVMAFFPCTRFEGQNYMCAKGNNYGFRNWSIEKKIEYSRKNVKEIEQNYELFSKLVLIALKKGFKLICENPDTPRHVLKDFFPINAVLIDKDRRTRGDKYKKPTQYWFINCEPKHNFIWEAQHYIAKGKAIEEVGKVERSMITKEYANRFIREFILEQGEF